MDRFALIKAYLQEHSLVESNITSFNNFLGERMQQIVNELNENMKNEEIEIRLGKIRIEKPNVIEADGSQIFISPAEVRIRNLTYSAPVFLEISVRQGNQEESHDVEIGRVPIMVKSKVCNTSCLSKEEMEKSYLDPKDPGGYFIINGNERVMVLI